MAGLDRIGKTQANLRADKFRQILNFLPEEVEGVAEPKETYQSNSPSVSLSAIHLPSNQPRRYFDPYKLEQLAASIKEHGVLESLLVRPVAGKQGQYELVAGERRYRAAKMAGLQDVPVTVRDLTDEQAWEIALVENLQREDLNPVEETEGILQLLSIKLDLNVQEIPSLLYKMQHEAKGRIAQNVLGNSIGQTIQQVFEDLGVMSWESFVSSRLPLLNLPSDILESLRQGKIAYTKAQAISRLKDEEQRKALLQEAISQDLSLSQIKERITVFKSAVVESAPPTLRSRLDGTLRQLKRSGALDDPKKQKRLEKLLIELETLIAMD